MNRLFRVGRFGAARRLVESEGRAHGPTLWSELSTRLSAATVDLKPQPGVAWFPVETAAPTDGCQGGLVQVQVSFDRTASDAFPKANRETWQAAVDVGLRAGGWKGGDQKPSIRFRPDIGGHHWLRVEGRSAELALAVAACSALRGVSVPAGVAFTGAVDVDATGRDGVLLAPEPTSLGLKLACLRDDWSPDARLVSGRGEAAVTEGYGRLSELLSALFPASTSRAAQKTRLPELLTRLSEQERAGHYADALRTADELWTARERLPSRNDAARVAIEGTRLANHCADAEGFQAWRARAEPLLPFADPALLATFAANVAIQAIDQGLAAEAIADLEAALAAMPDRPAPDLERVQILGTLARACSASGRHDDAIRFGELAYRFAPFSERPRNAGDAALWWLRAGQFDAALEALDETEALLEDVAADFDVELTRGFRALTRTRALLGLGRVDEAREARAGILRQSPNIVLTLGEAEVAVALGEALGGRLEGVKLDHPVLSRLRARIEYARPDGDRARAAEWARGFSVTELDEKVPY
jgi:tetratricopeptide (TPR) repeat protein